MFLTRLGFGAKMVVTGDITQIDLPKRTPSGLGHWCPRSSSDIDDIAFVQLRRARRGAAQAGAAHRQRLQGVRRRAGREGAAGRHGAPRGGLVNLSRSSTDTRRPVDAGAVARLVARGARGRGCRRRRARRPFRRRGPHARASTASTEGRDESDRRALVPARGRGAGPRGGAARRRGRRPRCPPRLLGDVVVCRGGRAMRQAQRRAARRLAFELAVLLRARHPAPARLRPRDRRRPDGPAPGRATSRTSRWEGLLGDSARHLAPAELQLRLRRASSTRCATQRNMWIHFGVAALVLVAAFFFDARPRSTSSPCSWPSRSCSSPR